MAWSIHAVLAVAELALYVLLFLPALIYSGHKHRRPGRYCHFCIFMFIIIRIIIDALAISDRYESTDTQRRALFSTGELPLLLLAAVATIKEARFYMQTTGQTQKAEKMNKLGTLIRIIVYIGWVLLVIGTLIVVTVRIPAQVGAILILFSWVLSCIWSIINLRLCIQSKIKGSTRILLIATTCALPFLGAAALYTTLYTFDHSGVTRLIDLSSVMTLCFVLLQMIAVISLLVGLLLSRDLYEAWHTDKVKREQLAPGLQDDTSDMASRQSIIV